MLSEEMLVSVLKEEGERAALPPDGFSRIAPRVRRGRRLTALAGVGALSFLVAAALASAQLWPGWPPPGQTSAADGNSNEQIAGWQPIGGPMFQPVLKGTKGKVNVELYLTWKQKASASPGSRCYIKVFDSSGRLVGIARKYVRAPRAVHKPPYDTSIFVSVSVAEPAKVSYPEAECRGSGD